MKDQFVPYEIAKLLKHNGFNELCFGWWCWVNGNYAQHYDYKITNQELIELNNHPNNCSSPLYQQVVDWFRDKHSIYIAVLPFREKSDVSDEYGIELCWYYSIVQDDEDLPDILCNEDDLGAHGDNFATPKIAWEEAFKEALKLI